MAYNTFGRYRYTNKDSARRWRRADKNIRLSIVSSPVIFVDELDVAIDMQMDLHPGASKSCIAETYPLAITLAEIEKM